MSKRFFISLLITMSFYTLLGFLLFYVQQYYFGTETLTKDNKISMNISTFIPEPEVPITEDKTEPEKEVEPEPEPIKTVEEEIIPEELVIEEKVVEPVKPVIAKPKIKKQIKKKKEKNKVAKKKKSTKKKVKRRASSSKKQMSPAKKNAFLAKIRKKINQYKAYPRIAQRRAMQGSVKVRFTILSSGKVGNITVRGPKIFHSSAKKAVQKAFPISTKNAPIALPSTVNFTLRYQIR